MRLFKYKLCPYQYAWSSFSDTLINIKFNVTYLHQGQKSTKNRTPMLQLSIFLFILTCIRFLMRENCFRIREHPRDDGKAHDHHLLKLCVLSHHLQISTWSPRLCHRHPGYCCGCYGLLRPCKKYHAATTAPSNSVEPSS